MAHRLPPDHVHPAPGSSRSAALDRAVRYIACNLDKPVRIEDVASAACVSRFHLARLFRAGFGTTPSRYIRRTRVQQASLELRHGHTPMAHIAAQFGFFDQSHFVRCFRQEMGCTPTLYTARRT